MSIYQRFSDKDIEILRTRAQRAAHSAQADQPRDLLAALVVMAGPEMYALPIEAVAGVHEGVALTPIPCVPPFVSGIANLRGFLILALDLAGLLGVAPVPPQPLPLSREGEEEQEVRAATLVELATTESALAFQVTGIRGIETLSTSDLAPVPTNIELKYSACVAGILPDGTALLKIDALLLQLSASTGPHDPALSVDSGQA